MDLTWVEPRAAWTKRISKAADLTPKRLAIYGLAVFAAAVAIRFLGTIVPGSRGQEVNWPVFLVLCFLGSMALAFLWPNLILLLSASHVIISRKGVNNNMQCGSVIRVNFWSWDSIGSASVSDTDLVLFDHDQKEIIRLGINPKIAKDRVREAVLSNGGVCAGD